MWKNRFVALWKFIPMILVYRFRLFLNRMKFSSKSPNSGISLLLPTYNRSGFLKCAMETIILNTTSPYEIVVVDNASTDDTDKVITDLIRKYPDAPIVHMKMTYNYGTNGYALAFLKSKYDFVVDMDDDILAVQKGWEKNVFQAFKDFDKLGFLALDVVQDKYTDGAKPDPSHYIKEKKGATTIQIGPTGGWFSVTSRNIYYKAGGFIYLPNKPFRIEDADFSRKVKKRGLICAILSNTYAYHGCGPIWNAKGKYHKEWKDKYKVDFGEETVNMVDSVTGVELPEFDVPEKAMKALSAKV